jgi:hypothetical protein
MVRGGGGKKGGEGWEGRRGVVVLAFSHRWSRSPEMSERETCAGAKKENTDQRVKSELR